MQFGVVKDL
jgi:hypothetical protein